MVPRIDRWIGSVELVAGANVFRFLENGTGYSITIAPGRYWLYDAGVSGDEIAGYPSLYRLLRVALDAVAGGGNTYSLRASNVPGETAPLYRGLHVVRNSGTLSFGWQLSSASFTAPKDVLGYAPDASTDATTTGASLPSPRGVAGVWVCPSEATSKVSYPQRKVEASTDEIYRADAYQLTWQEYRARLFRYRYVPAPYVHGARALDPSYTQAVGVSPGDLTAGLDLLWQRDLSRAQSVIVLHDTGARDDSYRLQDHPGKIEVVRLMDPQQRARLEACASLQIQRGEQYEVTLATVAIAGSYQQ